MRKIAALPSTDGVSRNVIPNNKNKEEEEQRQGVSNDRAAYAVATRLKTTDGKYKLPGKRSSTVNGEKKITSS